MIAEFRKKEKRILQRRRDKIFKLIFFICLIFIIFLVYRNFEIYKKRKILVSQLVGYQEKIESLKKDIDKIRNDIENVENPDYIEKVAYEELNRQRPGEKTVIFIMPENENKKEESLLFSKKKSFFENLKGALSSILDWIKNRF